MTRLREISLVEKNSEVMWVIENLRALYSNYRNAERQCQQDEQNNRRGGGVRQRILEANRAQFQLEYALGVDIPELQLIVPKQLRWITPELSAMRERAMGEGEFPVSGSGVVKRPREKRA